MPLRIQEQTYISGATYGVFFMGTHEIGRADKVGDGWRLPRARKVLPEEQAAKAMLDRAISKAREDEKQARKMLASLRLYCGGALPPDGSKPPSVGGEAHARTSPSE
jgi:hypothetical protein